MKIQHISGVRAELYIAIYFVEEGWDIFWPHAAQSKIDFIAVKEGTVKRVQCKKATWSQTGPYKYLQSRVSSRNKVPVPKYQKDDFDIIVFTDDEGRIWLTEIENILGMTSVCLDSTNPAYKPQTKYEPKGWRVK